MEDLTALAVEALYLALWLSLPALAVSFIAGLLVALFQSATQVHDYSLTFVPKVAAVGFALAVSVGWMGTELLSFTERVWETLP